MGVEIERKFLLSSDEWKGLAKGTLYRQGYLSVSKERTVRVRTVGEKGYLTVKGISTGVSRMEYEYEIPLPDAVTMLNELCIQPIIEKKRFAIKHKGFVWEVDEFFRENQGLIVAEIELEYEDQLFEKPDWIGEEVTGDKRYFNSSLAGYPYSSW